LFLIEKYILEKIALLLFSSTYSAMQIIQRVYDDTFKIFTII